MLRTFSLDHTHDKPTWMQFGEAANVYLYLSQRRASAAEEEWVVIANYVVNLLIKFINKHLEAGIKGKEFMLEAVEECTVGVASVANPSFYLFSLHFDAKPGIVDSAIAMYRKFMLMVPTLTIRNHCNTGRCADGCKRMPDATVPSRCTVLYSPLQSDALR